MSLALGCVPYHAFYFLGSYPSLLLVSGEIATYTGQDLGITGKNGTDTYRGILTFQTDSDGKLAFLDNVIGLYEYKSWFNGTKSGTIGEWK